MNSSISHHEIIITTKPTLNFGHICCFILLILLSACQKHSTKPDLPDIVPWTRVECFGTQPIFALSTSSDSTELRVVSTDKYGYLHKGHTAGDFILTSLAESIQYIQNNHITDYIPYFTNDKCFLGNEDGTRIDIYDIKAGAWDKIGELNIWDFISDTPEYTERFGRSHWLNLSNHITWAGGSQYYVTTEADRGAIPAGYGAIYKQFLISLTDTNPISHNLIYETIGFKVTHDTSIIFSTCFLGEHFLQDIYDNNCHIILSKDSPQYIQGSGNYPIRDRFLFTDYLIGMGDGVVMRSYDLGINWEEWLGINGPWSYALIGGKHVLFYINNITHWKLEESVQVNLMLESDAFAGSRIHYLKEFDGYVYSATDKGLFKKPISEFFTPRPESKNIYQPIIKRR